MRELVGFDLDSVLAHTEKIISKCSEDMFGITLEWNKISSYDFTTYPGYNAEMGATLLKEVESGKYLDSVRLYDCALSALDMVRDSDFDICIITSRPEHLFMPTMKWLDRHKVIYDRIYFRKSDDKHKLISELGIKSFVDDRSDIVQSIKDNCGLLKYGIYLVDHPWNRLCGTDGIVRVKDVEEAVDAIINRRDNYGTSKM